VLTVWSKPELNRNGKPLQAELDGTGLGLVSLVSVEKTGPVFVSKGDLIRLARFVAYMQNRAGVFYFRWAIW
jgi:hypothetical protein